MATITSTSSTSTNTPSLPKIALIISSTRTPRLGPSIATLIHSTLLSLPTFPTSIISLDILDIASFNLPLFNEPIIPMRATSSTDYHHAHSRAWSAAISSYSGFIFLTPQYNWSIPAALKNALDYLYNEWVGKPAMVVTYGGRGGGKAAEHLRQVLAGLRMDAVSGDVGLALHGHEGALEGAARGELFEEAETAWRGELERVGELFGVLVGKVLEREEKEKEVKEEAKV